jgi:hypothetical protein
MVVRHDVTVPVRRHNRQFEAFRELDQFARRSTPITPPPARMSSRSALLDQFERAEDLAFAGSDGSTSDSFQEQETHPASSAANPSEYRHGPAALARHGNAECQTHDIGRPVRPVTRSTSLVTDALS